MPMMPFDPDPEHVLDNPPFESVLQDLNVIKGFYPDGIPQIILKNCASPFAKPLYLLFNRSMETSVFPGRWKVSYVTPVFKKFSRNKF
jgi:hypothetical protein